MLLAGALLVWLVLSCIACPLIGAAIFRQFRDDQDYLADEGAVSRARHTLAKPDFVGRSESRPRPLADTPRSGRRWTAVSNVHLLGSRRVLH